MQRERTIERSRFGGGLAAIVAASAFALSLAAVLLSAIAPNSAFADEGDVCAYAYLYQVGDSDRYDLVLQAVEKPESEEGFVFAGKVFAGDAYSVGEGEYAYDSPDADAMPPWYRRYAGRIVSATVAEVDGVKVAPTNMALWFAYLDNLRQVDLSGLDASHVTDMSGLFAYSPALETVDLSTVDAGGVESMRGMFQSCAKLRCVVMPRAPTSSLVCADYLFESCGALASLSLGGLDISRVSDVSHMFYGCKALRSLDAASLDVRSATTMEAMFAWCESLDYLNLSNMDTAGVVSMAQLFAHCGELRAVDLSGSFTMGSVTDAANMFQACSSLQAITLGDGLSASAAVVGQLAAADGLGAVIGADKPWVAQGAGGEIVDGAEFADFPAMLEYAVDNASATAPIAFMLKSSVSGGGTGQGGESAIFAKLRGGDTLVLGADASTDGTGELLLGPVRQAGVVPWADYRSSIVRVVFEAEVAPMATTNWFRGLENLATIEGIEKLDTSQVTHMANMFLECASLTQIDVSHFDTAQVESMAGMFYGCSSLISLDLSGFDFSRVTTFASLCAECSSLETVKLPARVADGVSPSPNLANTESMFAGCAMLGSVDLSGLDTSGVTSMRDMFARCASLAAFDASSLSWANVSDAAGMFAGCTSLPAFDMTGVHASGLTDATSMFEGCAGLEAFAFGDAELRAVASAANAFAGCPALNAVTVGAEARLAQGMFPDGMWVRDDEPDEIYRSTDVAFDGSQAAVTFTRLAAHAGAYAALSSDGTLTISMTRRAAADEREYLIDPAGYDSPETVPWHAERPSISRVVVESSGLIASLAYWFSGCEALESVDVSGLEGAALTDMHDAFAGCASLRGIDLSAVNVPLPVDVSGLFDGCASLESAALPSGLRPTGAARMFRFCTSLTSVRTAGGESAASAALDMDTGEVADFSEMFRGCSALASLDVSAFDTRSALDMRRMFHGCRALESISIGKNFTFRGASISRLPGSEFPAGAWRPNGAGGTAYFSDSVPSFPQAAVTYVRLSDAEAEDPGITIVSIQGENADGEPALTVESTIDSDGAEELVYEVNDATYDSSTLFVGDSPRAASFNSTVIGGSSITSKTRKVKEIKSNGRITHVVVGSGVSKIGAKAFKGTGVTLLTVKSAKLTKKSSMKNCLTGSNVNTVFVSVSVAKRQKVKDAFSKWSGKKVRTA